MPDSGGSTQNSELMSESTHQVVSLRLANFRNVDCRVLYNVVYLVGGYKAGLLNFYVVWATLAKFGLHAGQVRTQNFSLGGGGGGGGRP
jgi:hypothetical protein